MNGKPFAEFDIMKTPFPKDWSFAKDNSPTSAHLIPYHLPLVKSTNSSMYFFIHSFMIHLVKAFIDQNLSEVAMQLDIDKVLLQCNVDIDKVLVPKLICWHLFLDFMFLHEIVDLHAYFRKTLKIPEAPCP